jgi:hypothetical protein
VLRPRVVRGHRRKRQLAVGLERAQPQHARRRLLAHAAQARRELGSPADDPRRQLGAVVDDDVGLEVGRGEQVALELVDARTANRMHLDPAPHERCADRVLRRHRVRRRRDDLRARVGEQRREIRRLRLEVDDDCDAAAVEGAVGEALAGEPVEHRRMASDPRDPLLAGVGKAGIQDPRPLESRPHGG